MSRNVRQCDTGRDDGSSDRAYEGMLKRHATHFLVALEALFDWETMCEGMIRLYKGHGVVGRPPYSPVLIFKMLFLSYLYNVSERAIEELADVHLLVKWFLGLAIDETPPDHSTLSVFKKRFLSGSSWQVLVGLFDSMIAQAQTHGLQLGDLQVLDSVHTQANVNRDKDRVRQEQGRPPRDAEAKVVHKGKRKLTRPDGKTVKRTVCYHGYKTHASVNAKTGIVTSVVSALGNSADNKAFPKLREHDRAMGLPTQAYGGDKAYDDTDIYERLAVEGLDSAITLKDQRTTKKDAHRERWAALKADPTYQLRVEQRYRVEQPFGIAKRWHGFERCRYLGLARYRIQALLTFVVLNAKRIVKLLTGITFRPQAKGHRAEAVSPILSGAAWV